MFLRIIGFTLGGLSFLLAHDKGLQDPLPLSYAVLKKSSYEEAKDNTLFITSKHDLSILPASSSTLTSKEEEMLALKEYFNMLDLMADRIFSLLSKEIKRTIDARRFSLCFYAPQQELDKQVILSFSEYNYFQALEFSTPLGTKPIALCDAPLSTIVEKLKGLLQLTETFSSNLFYVSAIKIDQNIYSFPSSSAPLRIPPDSFLPVKSRPSPQEDAAEIYESLYTPEE